MDTLDEEPTLKNVKICKNCRHYAAYIYENDVGGHTDQLTSDYGECRRFPPQVVQEEQSNFPIVDDTTWCGEFDF